MTTLIATAAVSASHAATPKPQTTFQFVFGPGPVAPGYTRVAPSDKYAPERGFGFEPSAAINPADGPVQFSVRVPEGNYTVTVVLGDRFGPSETTIRAESRRLMVEKAQTAAGQTTTATFTVNVRTPVIATGGAVHLKKRELGPPLDLNWDDKLTLEFSGARARVDSIRVAPAKAPVQVFLLGDSTVTDQPDEPWSAWGQMLPRFFGSEVAVANYAESGESLRTTIGARRVEKVLSVLHSGDYVFIQFGHNDQKEKGEGVGAFTTYKAALKQAVEEIRQHGGIPVLVTSMNRRRFDAAGKIVNTLGDYLEAVRQDAIEEKVPLVDLNAMSKTLFDTLGPDGTLKAFVHYPAGTFPGQVTALRDDTHFNAYGAYELAKCVVEGIRANIPALAPLLRHDTPRFAPAQPDPVSTWSLPPSVMRQIAKPAGN